MDIKFQKLILNNRLGKKDSYWMVCPSRDNDYLILSFFDPSSNQTYASMNLKDDWRGSLSVWIRFRRMMRRWHKDGTEEAVWNYLVGHKFSGL